MRFAMRRTMCGVSPMRLGWRFRIFPALIAASLMGCPIANALAADAPVAPRVEEATGWPISPELVAQGVGAFVGFGTYSLLLAPQAAAAGGILGILGGRVMAAALAGGGAVAGTFVYDLWTEQAIDYAYVWHRGGFVAGIAAGIAAFGVLGYPVDGGSTWLGWTANRAALVGTGLLGAWGVDHWYRRDSGG